MDGLVQNIVCLDSLNCNQVNTFFNSLWKIPPPYFRSSLYHSQGAFHSVLHCTCSLFFFSIFHFLFITFLAKTIQGSLHLICIITNTCRSHKRATSKRKQNKCRNKQDGGGILRLCPDLFIQQAWLPCLLGNASCLCCSR